MVKYPLPQETLPIPNLPPNLPVTPWKYPTWGFILFSHIKPRLRFQVSSCSQQEDLWSCYQLQTVRSCSNRAGETIEQQGGPWVTCAHRASISRWTGLSFGKRNGPGKSLSVRLRDCCLWPHPLSHISEVSVSPNDKVETPSQLFGTQEIRILKGHDRPSWAFSCPCLNFRRDFLLPCSIWKLLCSPPPWTNTRLSRTVSICQMLNKVDGW